MRRHPLATDRRHIQLLCARVNSLRRPQFGAHSLEVRHPFLDHRLVNFVVNLPTELKIHQGWTKYILRAALPEMPAALRWRRDKQGFLVPEQLWLKRELAR